MCVRHCSESGRHSTTPWVVSTQQIGVEKVLSELSGRSNVWAFKEPTAYYDYLEVTMLDKF